MCCSEPYRHLFLGCHVSPLVGRALQATQEPKVISWVATGLELEANAVPKHAAGVPRPLES